jgi:hypothetical protein
MNAWRWLGLSLFLLGALCFISTAKFPVLAGGKDKDKDKDAKVKDKDAKDKDKDAKDKDKDKDKEKDKKVVPPPPAGDKLEFKAFTGKPFFTEQTTKTKQVMQVMGQKVNQNQEQTFMIQWTPEDKDKDGNYVVKQQIVGVKMKIDIGGNNISYDSTLNNAKNPMTDFFEALMKKESVLTFTITPDLQVKSIEGRDKFIKSLIDINPQMQNLLKAILSEDALKKMAEPTWWAYPKDGVLPAKDATWTKSATLALGPIGNYKTDFTFTNKGEAAGKVDIGIKTKLEYTAPTEKAGLPFVITKAELKGENGEGKAIFDRQKGRFESTSLTMKLSGKISIDVGNMNTDVELNQDQDSTSITRDTLPTEWEKKSK